MDNAITSEVELVNSALARIGSRPLQSFDDENNRSRAAQLIYQTEVDYCLGLFSWPFAQKDYALQIAEENPTSGWRYAFWLPGDFIGAPVRLRYAARDPNALIRDKEILAGQLHCNFSTAWARGIVRSSPDVWPPNFKKGVIVALAAAFAVPESHDVNLAATLKQEAYGSPQEQGRGGLLGQAIATLVAAGPPPDALYDDNPLTGVRMPW